MERCLACEADNATRSNKMRGLVKPRSGEIFIARQLPDESASARYGAKVTRLALKARQKRGRQTARRAQNATTG